MSTQQPQQGLVLGPLAASVLKNFVFYIVELSLTSKDLTSAQCSQLIQALAFKIAASLANDKFVIRAVQAAVLTDGHHLTHLVVCSPDRNRALPTLHTAGTIELRVLQPCTCIQLRPLRTADVLELQKVRIYFTSLQQQHLGTKSASSSAAASWGAVTFLENEDLILSVVAQVFFLILYCSIVMLPGTN